MSGSATSDPVGPIQNSSIPADPPPPPSAPPPVRPPTPVTPPVVGAGPGLTGGCGLAGYRFYQSYLWKFIVTNLNTETLTSLDRLASDRRITYTFEDTTEISFSVPSDDKRVNIPHTDLDPKLDEGTRLLYGFRREGEGAWTCRASGLIMQAHDVGDADVSRTDVTAYDPWRYLDMLPIINYQQVQLGYATPGVIYDPNEPTDPVNLPDPWTTDRVILDQLALATQSYNDFFIDYGQTGFHSGGAGPGAAVEGGFGAIPLPNPYSIQNGASIGQMLRELCQDKDLGGRDYCDIYLVPVYDPINRPGILAELQIKPPKSGANRTNVVFSWGHMPLNTTGADRLTDGTQRANAIQNFHSRGGPPVPLRMDTASINKFRRYYRTKYFPTQGGYVETLDDLAVAQLILRAFGLETITVSPAPERANIPLIEYAPGDIVSVTTTRNMRKATSDLYQVLQIPVEISDEALETVSSLTLKKKPTEYVIQPRLSGSQVISESRLPAPRRTTITSLPGP